MSKKENETIVDEVNGAEGDSMPRVYEVSYILVPTMSEDSALNKAEEFKNSIASLGGSFISEETPYIRDLAYEMIRVIKNVNNRFDTGYFGWFKFEMPATDVANLEKKLKLDEEVIRFLIVKADKDVNIITKNSYQRKAREIEEANIDTASEQEQSIADSESEEKSKEAVDDTVTNASLDSNAK